MSIKLVSFDFEIIFNDSIDKQHLIRTSQGFSMSKRSIIQKIIKEEFADVLHSYSTDYYC